MSPGLEAHKVINKTITVLTYSSLLLLCSNVTTSAKGSILHCLVTEHIIYQDIRSRYNCDCFVNDLCFQSSYLDCILFVKHKVLLELCR